MPSPHAASLGTAGAGDSPHGATGHECWQPSRVPRCGARVPRVAGVESRSDCAPAPRANPFESRASRARQRATRVAAPLRPGPRVFAARCCGSVRSLPSSGAAGESQRAPLLANRRSEPISARRPVAQSKRGHGSLRPRAAARTRGERKAGLSARRPSRQTGRRGAELRKWRAAGRVRSEPKDLPPHEGGLQIGPAATV